MFGLQNEIICKATEKAATIPLSLGGVERLLLVVGVLSSGDMDSGSAAMMTKYKLDLWATETRPKTMFLTHLKFVD